MKFFLRLPDVCQRTGKRKSTIYREIGRGLIPPPVRIGVRTSGWPDHEIDEVNLARLRGQSNDEIRHLVTELVNARLTAEVPSQAA